VGGVEGVRRPAARLNPDWARVGQRVSNFVIRRLLGQGGMGAVYEAVHPTLRRRVAVKILRPELALDEVVVQRFFNEARAASSIRHPNIIEIVDLGLLPDGLPYQMMELLEGEPLSQLLAREGALPIDCAVDLILQATRALDAAHRQGIVHRDLKPENLFLIPDPAIPGYQRVKVLDFGIAKLLGDLSASSVHTVAGTVFGTPPYMSPEQCRGNGAQLDGRSDVYSLGIMLYEMLCGKTPFCGAGLGDVMMMHLTTEPLPPSQLRPDLPPALERVILTALAKRPADRFASMTQLSDALVWSCSQPVAETTRPDLVLPGFDPVPRRTPVRRRLLFGAGATALVLLATFTAQLAADRPMPLPTDPPLAPRNAGPEVIALTPRPQPAPVPTPAVAPAPARPQPNRQHPLRRARRKAIAAPAAIELPVIEPAAIQLPEPPSVPELPAAAAPVPLDPDEE
jgi:eukaryotic-like serine/threonine-protein kinase